MGYSLISDFAEQKIMYRFMGSNVEYALISDEDSWITPCCRFLADNSPYTTEMWLYDSNNWGYIVPHLLREHAALLRELDEYRLAATQAKNARLLQEEK